MFLAHGLLLKVLTFTIAGTVGYFQSIGYPGFFAYLVIAGEIGGGIALILGAYTRIVALLLLPILIGATLQHIGNGWLFSGAGRRLGVPGFLDCDAACAGAAWRRRLRLAPRFPAWPRRRSALKSARTLEPTLASSRGGACRRGDPEQHR